MLDLELIANLLKAHERLVIAIEDFTNMALNEKARTRLVEALAESRRLIQQAEE